MAAQNPGRVVMESHSRGAGWRTGLAQAKFTSWLWDISASQRELIQRKSLNTASARGNANAARLASPGLSSWRRPDGRCFRLLRNDRSRPASSPAGGALGYNRRQTWDSVPQVGSSGVVRISESRRSIHWPDALWRCDSAWSVEGVPAAALACAARPRAISARETLAACGALALRCASCYRQQVAASLSGAAAISPA